MTEVTHRTVATNGIRIYLAEAGEGPLILLCHGFPESWYSRRHQLAALAEVGFRAVAPDMRGYGRTDAPEAIDQYTLFHMIGDIVGLLDALGAEQSVIAGHDWGAVVAWQSGSPSRLRLMISLKYPTTAACSFASKPLCQASTVPLCRSISSRRAFSIASNCEIASALS